MESIARRVSRFRRDGWVDIGSRLLWYMWQRDVVYDQANMITRACTPPLITLGCIYGGPPNLPRPSELEFRLLCWELHNSPEPPNLGSAEARAAIVLLLDKQLELGDRHPMRSISEQELGHVWLEYQIGLIGQAQIRPFAYDPTDLVRPLLVYEKFRNSLQGEGRAALQRLERTFFGLDWAAFLRCFMVAVAVGNADALADIGPGRIDIDDVGAAENPPLGVTPSDLKVFMARLGTQVTSFAAERSALDGLPSHAQKYHPIVRRLDTRPVVLLDDYSNTFAVSIPSPWHLRGAIESYLIDEFIGFAKAHDESHPLGANAWSARGRAFHEYLAETLRDTDVLNLDDASQRGQGKKPDFIWIGRAYGIVIEAKVRLGPNCDPWGHDPLSIWESWRRGVEAVEQASAFVQRDCDRIVNALPERWVLVIVTLQPMGGEATSFRTAAKRFRFLADTGLDALAVVSPAEIEHFTLEGDADGYAARVHRQWEDLDPYSLLRPNEGVGTDHRKVPRPLTEAWERFLPQLRVPWA